VCVCVCVFTRWSQVWCYFTVFLVTATEYILLVSTGIKDRRIVAGMSLCLIVASCVQLLSQMV